MRIKVAAGDFLALSNGYLSDTGASVVNDDFKLGIVVKTSCIHVAISSLG